MIVESKLKTTFNRVEARKDLNKLLHVYRFLLMESKFISTFKWKNLVLR